MVSNFATHTTCTNYCIIPNYEQPQHQSPVKYKNKSKPYIAYIHPSANLPASTSMIRSSTCNILLTLQLIGRSFLCPYIKITTDLTKTQT
jgi:hypothetical protein